MPNRGRDVVTKNIPDYALVIGNPGKIIGWVNKLGERLKFSKGEISDCGEFILKSNILKKIVS